MVEGCAYLLETAAFHNMKTATFGQALLQIGLSEALAVAFGNVWTASSAATVNRLRSKPFGAPLMLSGTSHRLSLGLGSSAATRLNEATVVLDLALVRTSSASASHSVEEVLSLELDRAALAGLQEQLDAVQSQLDSLS